MGCSLVSFLTGSDFIVSVLVVIVEGCFRHRSLRLFIRYSARELSKADMGAIVYNS